MKKTFCFIYILLICSLAITGCQSREYPATTSHTLESSYEVSTTFFEEPTTEEPTTVLSPYEQLLADTPISEGSGTFFIDSPVPITKDSYIITFSEWQNGIFIAVIDFLTYETNLYYLDLVSREIFATAILPTLSTNLDAKLLNNGNIIISDFQNYCFYLYDKQLTLLATYTFPSSAYMDPILSKDGKFAYYSAKEGTLCYRLDLETGISTSIITANEGIVIYPCDLISRESGDILVLWVHNDSLSKTTYEYYNLNGTEFITALDFNATFEPCGDKYGVRLTDSIPQLLYLPELNAATAKEFFPNHEAEYYSYWFQTNQTLITSALIDDLPDPFYNYFHIRIYDLNTGLCTYETKVQFDRELYGNISQITYSSKYNAVIGIYENYETEPSYFLWDLNSAESCSRDETVYLGKYYSPNEINWDGILALKKSAADIASRHGVTIRIADDTRIDTGDYIASQIFQTALIRNALTVLDEALSNYPVGFFTQLKSSNGALLEINLSGTISPVDGYDSISTAIGLHNYNYGDQYVILDINNLYLLETTIYHEIFHAVDKIIVFNSTYFDDAWSELNPADFEYDYGYTSNESNNDSTYLYYTDEGYFIDIYSKSFPNEDRARIIENAMSGNRYYFESAGLRNKLEYICRIIREVFDSSTWEETTCWEYALLPWQENIPENTN